VVVSTHLDATKASLWLGLLLTLLASLIYLKLFYFYILFFMIIASYMSITILKFEPYSDIYFIDFI
jgi:hypothetical protein